MDLLCSFTVLIMLWYTAAIPPLVAAEVQRVLAFGRKETDSTFCKIVRNRITTVLDISESLLPKLMKIIKGLTHITTSLLLLTFQLLQQVYHRLQSR